jgi:hypothetical protein
MYALTPKETREIDEIMLRLMARLSEPRVREHFNDPDLLVVNTSHPTHSATVIAKSS